MEKQPAVLSAIEVVGLSTEFNKLVADLFPPHPLAVAPSEVLDYHVFLNSAFRCFINKDFGEIKQKAARRNKYR